MNSEYLLLSLAESGTYNAIHMGKLLHTPHDTYLQHVELALQPSAIFADTGRLEAFGHGSLTSEPEGPQESNEVLHAKARHVRMSLRGIPLPRYPQPTPEFMLSTAIYMQQLALV